MDWMSALSCWNGVAPAVPGAAEGEAPRTPLPDGNGDAGSVPPGSAPHFIPPLGRGGAGGVQGLTEELEMDTV
jgi:hypothetical protein